MTDDQQPTEALDYATVPAEPVSPATTRGEHRRRDAEALTIIGAFFALLAVLVLVGVIWHDRGPGLPVGIGAGLLLLLVGVGAVAIGRRLRRVPK